MYRQKYGAWLSLIVSVLGLGLIVWKIEPQTASLKIKALFFVVIMMAVWSLATLIIFSIKSRFARSRLFDEAAYEPVFYDSLLQGLLVAGVIMAAILIRRFLV